jgi:8-oxo-dGTP diphosphatase
MSFPPSRLVVGAALVDDLTRPTRILAARRHATTHAGGWEFPGGKVEPGEAPLAALHRELREELDLPVTVGRELRGPMPDGAWPISDSWRIRVWLAEPSRVEIRPGGAHDAVRWLAADELYSVNWLPADDPIVASLRTLMVPATA